MAGWKDILRSVAPTLATAIGGPMAGMAVKAIGDKVLGKPDATLNDISAAIAATTDPSLLLKLKEADQQFAKDMAQIGLDLEKLDVEDRASARARQVALKDHTPTVLAAVVLLGFLASVWFVCTQAIPKDTQPVVMTMLGTLGTLATTVMTYYFGSSSSSRAKDNTIAGLSK